MAVTEQASVLARIIFEPLLCRNRLKLPYRTVVYRIVRLSERAFAVPSVAGMMLVPERVVHRQGEFPLPVMSVQRVLVRRSSRYPPDIGIDISLIDEVLPVCSLVSSYYSGVVLCLQPWPVKMVRFLEPSDSIINVQSVV